MSRICNQTRSSDKKMRYSSFCAWATLVAVVLQAVVTVASWIVAAAMPGLPVRSLLSGEGIRWLLGQAVGNVTSPLLVWLLLIAAAAGSVGRSGLARALSHPCRQDYHHKIALRAAAAEVAVAVVVMCLLTLAPHALLLSATGRLFPGSFPRSIVPVAATVVMAASVTFGWVSGETRKAAGVFGCLTWGLHRAVPLLPVYFVVTELVCSVGYVLQANSM